VGVNFTPGYTISYRRSDGLQGTHLPTILLHLGFEPRPLDDNIDSGHSTSREISG